MIAAIYARKSTEQLGLADDQKSIARQVEHARQYAERKGWTVDESHVYVDDGISGAEFANRPGFPRLMNSLKPRPGFQVLVMSEESRLGREAIETAYALKQLVQAGVRVFFYMEDRERTLDSPTDKIMLSLTAFADGWSGKRLASGPTMPCFAKAKAGHVTGGRVFGYDNVDVLGPDGKRSHVQRRICQAEAAIVRRIFEMCAAGTGYTRIAKQLNDERAPCPRPQQARPAGWSPSTVHEILKRPIYRGQIVWNQTRKRDRWGRKDATGRPEAAWLTVHAPDLRIVSDVLWTAARERLTGIKSWLMAKSKGPWGRHARDVESVHLLTGFARCAVCGASFYPLGREHGKQRVFFYGCSAHHKRGRAVCGNGFVMRKERIDDAVLEALGGDVLKPAMVTAVIDGVFAALRRDARHAALDGTRVELATIEREITRLTEAIATGGDMMSLLAALKARQARQADLQRAIATAGRGAGLSLNRRAVERQVRERLTRWRALLTGDTAAGRELFRQVLTGPIRFTPNTAERCYRFEGEVALGRLFSGIANLAPFMASPAGRQYRACARLAPTPTPYCLASARVTR
jgi:DNA invertase Pin-like site-specific DNA recombinase